MKKKIVWISGVIGITLIGITVIGLNYTGSNTSRFAGPINGNEPIPKALISEPGEIRCEIDETI